MDPRPIGVFDSGVGGLTVFKALEETLQGESLVYLGDTARVPYGTRSPETVVRYSLEATRFLRSLDVKMIVIACNSASSTALEAVSGAAQAPVLGVIVPGARRAVKLTRTGRIGVIGTRATVNSEAYTRAIRLLKPEAEVTGRPCPLFVPLAEEGWVDNDVALRTAGIYLEPFREARIDTLVLGCTHYPLLREIIGRVAGPSVQLVDSAESVAAEVKTLLESNPHLSAPKDRKPEPHRFWVTDVPGPFLSVAERFLGRELLHLERAELGEPAVG